MFGVFARSSNNKCYCRRAHPNKAIEALPMRKPSTRPTTVKTPPTIAQTETKKRKNDLPPRSMTTLFCNKTNKKVSTHKTGHPYKFECVPRVLLATTSPKYMSKSMAHHKRGDVVIEADGGTMVRALDETSRIHCVLEHLQFAHLISKVSRNEIDTKIGCGHCDTSQRIIFHGIKSKSCT